MPLSLPTLNSPNSMLDSQGADPQAVDKPTTLRSRYGRRAILWSAIAASYWLTLVVATHLPTPEAIVGNLLNFDKVIHAGAYFVLATVLFITARRLGSSNRISTRLLIVLAVLAYGVFDELTQPYFGRSCDLADWLADGVGVSLAFVIDLIRKR